MRSRDPDQKEFLQAVEEVRSWLLLSEPFGRTDCAQFVGQLVECAHAMTRVPYILFAGSRVHPLQPCLRMAACCAGCQRSA